MSEAKTGKYMDMELDRLHKIIAQMGQQASEQLELAVKALKARDRGLAWKIVEADEKINALQQEADFFTVRTLALQQPVARDLRSIVSGLKMATDLERIADYAANVAKHVLEMEDGAPIEAVDALCRMGDAALAMLGEAMAAYDAVDAKRAEAVWPRDKEVNEVYSEVLDHLKAQMAQDPEAIKASTRLLYVARCIERIGDHITNLAEHIYYQATGQSMRGGH